MNQKKKRYILPMGKCRAILAGYYGSASGCEVMLMGKRFDLSAETLHILAMALRAR